MLPDARAWAVTGGPDAFDSSARVNDTTINYLSASLPLSNGQVSPELSVKPARRLLCLPAKP